MTPPGCLRPSSATPSAPRMKYKQSGEVERQLLGMPVLQLGPNAMEGNEVKTLNRKGSRRKSCQSEMK